MEYGFIQEEYLFCFEDGSLAERIKFSDKDYFGSKESLYPNQN